MPDQITLMGINHKTAPVELRETLSFSREETDQMLRELNAIPGINESMMFSTCNRTEVLVVTSGGGSTEKIKALIASMKKIPVQSFDKSLYIYQGDEAVKHMFRVASSLDSMIVGEPQILGQVKAAYRTTVAMHTTGAILNRLMHKAFNIAKKVRRETGIGDNAVSISYAAVELAHKIFSDLTSRNVMLLGAGEMAELAVEHLITGGVKKIVVANRTFKNALTLAERFHGEAAKFEERENLLREVDIIISSTGATDYVLTRSMVKQAMRSRKHRPIFFIDIAVPRDIEPAVNRINNAYLYDIDDLQDIVSDNMKERQKEALRGERYVEEAVVKFRRWLDSLAVVPTIKELQEKLTAITGHEMEKTMAGLKNLSPEEIRAIHRMTQAITRKFMHDPILFLKNIGEHRDDARYLSTTRQLFNLDNNGD